MAGKKDKPKDTPIAEAIKDKDKHKDEAPSTDEAHGFAVSDDQRDTTDDKPE